MEYTFSLLKQDDNLEFITNYKEYCNDIYKYFEAEQPVNSSIDRELIKYTFYNGKHFTLRDKVKYSSLIEDIKIFLEELLGKTTDLIDIFAFTTTENYFIKNIDSLDLNTNALLPKELLKYKKSNRPFPYNMEFHEILVSISFENSGDLLSEHFQLLLLYFPNLSYEILDRYFKDTQITLILNQHLFIGNLDSNLIFKSYKNGTPFEIDLNKEFNYHHIFPNASIFF
ncbi:MAG TPA: hypothetical protein VNR61_09780 [Niallia sp.]|nr:hypothetical protein [Niallia sp.]